MFLCFGKSSFDSKNILNECKTKNSQFDVIKQHFESNHSKSHKIYKYVFNPEKGI